MKILNKTVLAFGGNLGNTLLFFKKAIIHLNANGFFSSESSPIFKTPAVNCESEANDFYNFVLTGYWYKSPLELLELCQKTEQTIGRPENHTSNESRLIDIDIIFLGNLCTKTEKLTIPHPRAHERLFVMIPLNEVAPDWIHPIINLPVEEILNKLKTQDVKLFNNIYETKILPQ
jgi:2-amino-4-hydroxy-6-hydroxymethyldihydropteridine diphosphokinase